MPTPIEMFTTVIVVPEGGLTLSLTLDTTFGGTPKNFRTSVVAAPILPEGNYSFFVFLAKTNALLRQWILDCATGLSITTRPSLANTLLKFVVPATFAPTKDANKISVTFAPTGFAIGANPMVLVTGTLDNAGGFWSKLGMVREATSSMNPTSSSSSLLQWDGARQPESLYVFERQGEDLGDQVEEQLTTRVLRDGTVRNHLFGSARADRIIRLFDQEGDMLGGPLPVATFSSIASNAVLTLATTDENGLTNASNLYQNEDIFTTGYFYRVGLSRHISRIDTKSGSPKTTSATFFNRATDNAVAQMVAGQTLDRLGEYYGLYQRMLVDGYVIYHEPDDTTNQVRFKGEPYAPAGNGKIKLTPNRVDGFFDLWEVTLPLVRRDVPELVL